MPRMDENLLNDVVAAALKAGADAAEAVGAERRALSITVRTGALEEVEREESRDLGLRVFVGKRQASVSGSDVSAEALAGAKRARRPSPSRRADMPRSMKNRSSPQPTAIHGLSVALAAAVPMKWPPRTALGSATSVWKPLSIR